MLSAPDQSPLQRGTVINEHLLLIEEIASSTSHAIWDATDLSTNRCVALKIEQPQPSDPHEVAGQNLRHEHMVLGLFRHPGIIRCLGYYNGPPAAIMLDRLYGPSLHLILERNRRLPWRRLEKTAYGLAEALVEVHRQGVLHLDVKPGNIVVTANQGPVLIDFGISRIMNSSPLAVTKTIPRGYRVEDTLQSHLVTCSPVYTSPEQLRQEALTPQTDMYGFGGTLYRCLAGRPVFPGSNLKSLIRQHTHDNPARLGFRRAPRSIKVLIDSCLAKQPGDRPTAQEAVNIIGR